MCISLNMSYLTGPLISWGFLCPAASATAATTVVATKTRTTTPKAHEEANKNTRKEEKSLNQKQWKITKQRKSNINSQARKEQGAAYNLVELAYDLVGVLSLLLLCPSLGPPSLVKGCIRKKKVKWDLDPNRRTVTTVLAGPK